MDLNMFLMRLADGDSQKGRALLGLPDAAPAMPSAAQLAPQPSVRPMETEPTPVPCTKGMAKARIADGKPHKRHPTPHPGPLLRRPHRGPPRPHHLRRRTPTRRAPRNRVGLIGSEGRSASGGACTATTASILRPGRSPFWTAPPSAPFIVRIFVCVCDTAFNSGFRKSLAPSG